MGKKLVVFGSVVQDLISYTPRFPRPGESVRGVDFKAGPGGKGANQAVAAARLGAHVELIAMVGSDLFGDANISSLRDADVGVDGVSKSGQKSTATATITVSEQGENSIVVVLGANEELTDAKAETNRLQIERASMLLCQNEIPQSGTRRALQIGKEAGGYGTCNFLEDQFTSGPKETIAFLTLTTFFNPAPGDSSLDRSILRYVDIVCTNENEAEFLTGISASTQEGAIAAAEKMLTMGPHTAIVTLGPEGVVLAQTSQRPIVIQSLKVDAVDTTGAGDCFCGSLAYFLIHRNDLSFEEAVRRATSVASYSVTRKGTQASYQKKEELEKIDPFLFA